MFPAARMDRSASMEFRLRQSPEPRRLVLPLAIQIWSLTSLQQGLFKIGGRFIPPQAI